MTVKKILITTRVDRNNTYGEARDSIDQRLVEWVSDFGYTALPVPNCLSNPVDWAQSILPDGILLSGGNDIHPATYGRPGNSSRDAARNRDGTELALIRFAVSRHLPVVGICRGMQMINVAFGGTLLQQPADNENHRHLHSGTTHPIALEAESFLKDYSGTRITVNSYHNQGLRRSCLARELKPLAYAQDGIIEALIHRNYPIGGVQWHPERPGGDPAFDRFFVNYCLTGPDVRPS